MSMFLSCNLDKGGTNYSKIDSAQDSILFYYTISTKDSISLEQKKKAIDKSLFFAKNIGTSSTYSRVLYQKSLINFSLTQYDSLQIFNELLVNHASKIDDKDILARQSYFMAHYFNKIIHMPDSAFSYYTLSKNYFEQIKDSSWVGRNLLNMGVIQKDHNDYFGSKETLTEALQLLNPQKDRQYITYCYSYLGTNHRKLLNYNDAVAYHLKSIETSGSKVDKLFYQNNLAATYIDNQEYKKAIILLKSTSKDPILINNQKEYPRVLDNLAYVKWLSGVTIRENKFQEPLRIRIKNNDQRGQIASYTHLGEYNSKLNPKRAKAYFDSVIQLSKRLKMPRAEKDVLKLLMGLEPANVKIRDRYVFLQDSLYAQELKVKTQFAKYKYDDKLKQESILRLEKEKAEKDLEVAHQRNQKVLSYFGVGFLVLLFGFITYYFRQRSLHLKQLNKTAKIEATFETEEELSRKLHDDFGGKLNHTMLLLQNNADTSEVLDVVESLYNQSRDFSRKINDVDTGPNFKNLLLGMLGSYSKNTKLVLSGSKTLDWNNLSELTKKTLYRVLQELMNNMQKYSNAALVNINFEQTKKALKVSYLDNGVGATKDNLNNRNGLWNTEKRIQAIGGTIIFDSEKGKGFKVKIKIPN